MGWVSASEYYSGNPTRWLTLHPTSSSNEYRVSRRAHPLLIRYYVLDDVGCSVSQRVGLPTVIFRGRDPAITRSHLRGKRPPPPSGKKEKSSKVHPVFAVGITRQ